MAPVLECLTIFSEQNENLDTLLIFPDSSLRKDSDHIQKRNNLEIGSCLTSLVSLLSTSKKEVQFEQGMTSAQDSTPKESFDSLGVSRKSSARFSCGYQAHEKCRLKILKLYLTP